MPSKDSSKSRLGFSKGLLFPKTDYRKEKRRKKREKKDADIAWHDKICEKAKVGSRYLCYHCGGLFPRNEVCGDHFPHTKGSRPDLRHDENNGVCSCKPCNVSNAKTRKKP